MDFDNKKEPELTHLYNLVLDYILKEYKNVEGGNTTQKAIASRIDETETTISRERNKKDEAKRDNQIRLLKKFKDHYPIKISKNLEVSFRHPKDDEKLQSLARRLAINLVDVSTEFKEKNKPHEAILESDKAKEICRDSQNRERFIMVIGAGASFAATDGFIPKAEEGIKKIKERISKKIDEELLDEELERLSQTFRLDPNNFETQLLAYSKFTRKEVVSALKDLCDFPYVSSISYEIIAHMLKHRLIDIIVNFNYDEILDAAISEEIYDGDYKFIFSDGHCPDEYEKFLIQNRLKQPVYIKPHGTISHQNSLLFTREDYFSIPQKLRKTISELFLGKVRYAAELNFKDRLELNLIIVGYNLVGFEFIPIIKDYLEKSNGAKVRLWVFDTHDRKQELLQELPSKWVDCFECYFFDLKEHRLETYLTTLWELIEGNFKDKFRPKGIERHLVIKEIFKPTAKILKSFVDDKKVNGELLQYFRDRFYVELMMSLLQSGGILNARQILEDRAGKYFNLYQERLNRGQEKSLRYHCRQIGLKVYKGFVWDTFTLGNPNLFYDGENLYKVIYDHLVKQLQENYRTNLQKNRPAFLQLCSSIREGNMAKITPHYTNLHNHLFSNIKQNHILNTSLAWTYSYQKALKEKKWDLMLVISEKGRFLSRDIEEGLIAGKKVELVLASNGSQEFDDISTEHRKLLEGNLNLLSKTLKFLPWWLHNKHLVLLLELMDENKTDWTERWALKEGYYYESRMLSRRINPVRITNRDDMEILLYIFANYWYRAKFYTNCSSAEKSIPIISDHESMNTIIEELLALYDENE